MLTPKFKLSQSDSELIVKIHAPFAKISDTDINIEGNSFIFYSSPYYLRLTLPGKLIDSEKEFHKATFDGDEGAFIVKCIKQTFGEHFQGLDMLTQLLTPKGTDKVNKPLIEVLGEGTVEGEAEEEEDDSFDWFYEQTLPEDVENASLGTFKYGFANSHTNVFSTLRSEFSSLIDIIDPDLKPVPQRRKERLENERDCFKEEHYLADLFEKETVTPCIHFQPTFYNQKKEEVEYTSAEEESLLKLPRKEILIDQGSRACIYFGLVDILFAWCYNHRITQGENCAESAWNIAKLSSTLSWLDCLCSLKDAVTCAVRRSLIFTLVRNWEVSVLALQDTIQILSLGKKPILKCFLEIHSLFNNYEPYYILNQLYITDYCVWIQTVKEEKFVSLADSLRKVSVSKEEMELELVELECAAEMVLREEEEEAGKKREAEENLNNTIHSLDRMSVIENVFALGRNDNDVGDSSSPVGTLDVPPPPALPPPPRAPIAAISDSEDDSSDEDESSDGDDSDDEDSSSSDSDSSSGDSDSSSGDSDSSSSGTSSLDSDDDEATTS